MFIIRENEIKSYILSLQQEEIFAKYLGISVADIYYCLESKNNCICNPLRHDEHPSLSFMYNYQGKLKMKDFANDMYNGDIFHVVGLMLNLNCNSKKDFKKICEHIIKNLNNVPYSNTLKTNKKTIPLTPSIFNLIYRDFYTEDLNFWNSFGLCYKDILNKIFPISIAYLNNKQIYYYTKSDPCYAYKTGFANNVEYYKLYFPLRDKGKLSKFITNNRTVIECPNEIKEGNILVLCKSYKDKLLLEKLQRVTNTPTNIQFLSLNSESVNLDKLLPFLKSKYDKIVLFLDQDITGVNTTFTNYKLFGIIPFFLPKNVYIEDIYSHTEYFMFYNNLKYKHYLSINRSELDLFIKEYINYEYPIKNSKDISDFYKNNGLDDTVKIYKLMIDKITYNEIKS